MATVYFPPGLQQYTGGATSAEVSAGQIRRVLREVGEKFPELDVVLKTGTAVSIDGVMIQAPLLEMVGPESEVHLIPQISGG